VRYFLIDRIDELRKLSYAVGTKCISLSDDCFDQHFPGQPVYPGALLVEAMAQLGGALLEISLRETLDHCPRCVMSSVKAKFRDFARPGDVLTLRAEVVSQHDDSALVRATGRRGDDRICEAEILYVLLRIDDPRLQRAREEFLDTLTRSTRFVE
jgi:3-hydroxymyristoyl/3-hydroxydecanoyl-(acyl carrier protein) dehydratase